jgi:hypothetical protein
MSTQAATFAIATLQMDWVEVINDVAAESETE